MSLADLNELTLLCRTAEARSYLSEAVASYNVNAFRSSIIATWNAVVFDFLHKLRELDLTGDKQAKAKLAEFEVIRAGGASKLKEALDFERGLLASAENEFELLTPTERLDLDRLQEDRNRCAHPSMQSADEPYQPPAELARTHIRNAVQHLLSKEPVQGKAAFDRIVAEIKSPYFPRTEALARQHFDAGPLRRARRPLIRSLVIGLCKSLLNDNNPPDERSRQVAAVRAILDMHRQESEAVVREDLPKIMSGVAPDALWKLIALCGAIPVAWDSAGVAVQGTCERYLNEVTDPATRPKAIAAAFGVPKLQPIAAQRVNTLGASELGDAIAEQPVKEFKELATSLFAEAASFRQAESHMERLIMPLASVFESTDLERILASASENGQIWDAGGLSGMLLQFFHETARLHGQCAAAWQGFRTKVSTVSSMTWRLNYAELEKAMQAAGM